MDIEKLIKEFETKKSIFAEDVVFLKGQIVMIDEEKKRKENKLHEISGRIVQISETINVLKSKPKQGIEK